MHILRTTLIAFFIGLTAFASTEPSLAKQPVHQTLLGTAIDGADAVAYFTEGRAIAGSSKFTYKWNGATWRFSSAQNRDLFAANPKRYAPQYGGYCAYAVSEGYTASIDPDAWKIVDGKLYLNYSKKVQAVWEQNIPGRIKAADGNWPTVLQ